MNVAQSLAIEIEKSKTKQLHQNLSLLFEHSTFNTLFEQPQRLFKKGTTNEIVPCPCSLFVFSDSSVISNYDYLSSIAVPPEVTKQPIEEVQKKSKGKVVYLDKIFTYPSIHEFCNEQRVVHIKDSDVQLLVELQRKHLSLKSALKLPTASALKKRLNKLASATLDDNSLLFHPAEFKTLFEGQITKAKYDDAPNSAIEIHHRKINDFFKQTNIKFIATINHHNKQVTCI